MGRKEGYINSKWKELMSVSWLDSFNVCNYELYQLQQYANSYDVNCSSHAKISCTFEQDSTRSCDYFALFLDMQENCYTSCKLTNLAV